MLARSHCLFLTRAGQDWGREEEVHKHGLLTPYNRHSEEYNQFFKPTL